MNSWRMLFQGSAIVLSLIRIAINFLRNETSHGRFSISVLRLVENQSQISEPPPTPRTPTKVIYLINLQVFFKYDCRKNDSLQQISNSIIFANIFFIWKWNYEDHSLPWQQSQSLPFRADCLFLLLMNILKCSLNLTFIINKEYGLKRNWKYD